MMTTEDNKDGKAPTELPPESPPADSGGGMFAVKKREVKKIEGAPPLASVEDIMAWLQPVEDPELYLSVVELGLVYEAKLDEAGALDIRMTLTSPGCPAGDYIMHEMKHRALEHPSVSSANVHIVWEPKWDPGTMASDEIKDRLGIW